MIPFVDMNYTYRLVFTYLGDPKKIQLPFVSYHPSQAIFHFENILGKEERLKVEKIAKTLNQAVGHPVKVQEEFKIGNEWTPDYNRKTVS